MWAKCIHRETAGRPRNQRLPYKLVDIKYVLIPFPIDAFSDAPPPGFYAMGSGNGGLVANGRATPASFAGQISAPQHFKFPPEGNSQVCVPRYSRIKVHE